MTEIDFKQELYKAFGQVKDFTLGMRIAKWFYDMGKKNQEHVSDTQSPVIFYGLTGSVSSPKEEPVSEDLEEVAHKYADGENPTCPCEECLIKTFKASAQWQKEQFEKNRLAHCDAQTEEDAEIESDFVTQHLKKNNRTPTFIDAIKYGMRLKEQQLMSKAIDAKLLEGHLIRQKGVTHPLHVGDKVKVIVIKED